MVCAIGTRTSGLAITPPRLHLDKLLLFRFFPLLVNEKTARGLESIPSVYHLPPLISRRI